MPAPRTLAALVAGAVVLAAASLLVARVLGYDPWAWMVWSRELVHGDLHSAAGPAFKPLPVLVSAPLVPFGDAAPDTWLIAMRACALLALLAAYRIGRALDGAIAGITAAALLAAGPDLYRTALYGSSEPLLVLLVLLAAGAFLAGRPRTALLLLGAGGLMRPELWPVTGGLALLFMVRARRADGPALAAAAVPPVIWLALAAAASGSAGGAGQLIHIGTITGPGAAPALPLAIITVNEHTTPLGVLGRLTESLVIPALALAAYGLWIAVRRGRRDLALVGWVGLGWVALVAAMAADGYPGSRRYLVGPAALLALLAGSGLARLVAAVRARHHARTAVLVGLGAAALMLAFATPTLLESARLVGTARAEERTERALGAAVALAGGRAAVLAEGRPAVNPWLQTALAWRLRVPLDGIQPTWNSTRRQPHWRPPAVLFRGPEHDAGPAPALSTTRPVRRLGRTGGWTVLRTDP